MSANHPGGQAIPSITREEHRSVNGVDAKAVAPYGFDGTNLQPLKTDTSGRLTLDPNSVGGGATSSNSAETDMFGTSIVGELNNQVEVHFDNSAYATFLTQTKTGGGTDVQANGRVAFTTSTGTSGRNFSTSLDNIYYRPHFPSYAAFTAAFVTPPTSAGDLAYVGLGDATNGLFVGYKGTSFGLIYRQNSVDTFVAQANFNWKERGIVQTAVTINPQFGNVWKVEVGLFGYAGGRVRIFDGATFTWHTVHEFVYAGTAAEPFFTNFDLPMSLEVRKFATDATNVQINTSCWGGGSSSLLGRMTDPITDRTLGETSRTVIFGHSTAGGGTYPAVKVTPSGSLTTASNIADTNGNTISASARTDGVNAMNVADDMTSFESFTQALAGSTDTTITFSQTVRLIRVKNNSTSAVIYVRDGAIASDSPANAELIGVAAAANLPNTEYYPFVGTTIHLRSAGTPTVSVTGFF